MACIALRYEEQEKVSAKSMHFIKFLQLFKSERATNKLTFASIILIGYVVYVQSTVQSRFREDAVYIKFLYKVKLYDKWRYHTTLWPPAL